MPKTDTDKNRKELSNQQNNISSSIDKTIEIFNIWAKNPSSPLPAQFGYVEGDLKLRVTQYIQLSYEKYATWIINKLGPIWYLFPNPNAIEQLSGKIDMLYTVTGTRRARGLNKVNIELPCFIKEKGWIENKGRCNLIENQNELTLYDTENVSQLYAQYQEIEKQIRQLSMQQQSFVQSVAAQFSAQKIEIEQLKKKLNSVQLSTVLLKGQLDTQKSSLKIIVQQNNTSSSLDQTIEVFNIWAKDIGSPLPSQFNYAEGDLKLREKQTIQFSNTNKATWIVNKSGQTKYLFPNPNAIDYTGKIDAIYTVKGTRKDRGLNRVKIQNACVIKEDGWIEYKGELSLL